MAPEARLDRLERRIRRWRLAALSIAISKLRHELGSSPTDLTRFSRPDFSSTKFWDIPIGTHAASIMETATTNNASSRRRNPKVSPQSQP